ncbi:hypothetical protein SPI_03826 [Niveomyces insectorum RCEF 264]|uniref:Utp8 beta-propeller domain-containing protein n=1 Tax=Niveomyces insectorum RCEF 264 TaxID=1081102 RepID=A0A167WDZ3_9HYPO|nr:hypothetical protein SPI_03826 [Niveomyces insectorum RCEF 264]
MASNYHIQPPYMLASLPRSLAQPDGKCVVGEVYGQRPGTKKRRRPEVVVGVDGESANIYDIANSRLVTSYPVPPQATFLCPPCSVRYRSAVGRDATTTRYTYTATREPARKLSLFKDTVEAAGASVSTTITASLRRTSAIVSLFTVSASGSNVGVTGADVLAVDHDGQVACYDGETLQEKYAVSIAAMSQDLLPRGAVLQVEFAQLALAADVLKGLALGADYLSGVLVQKIDAEQGFNPDVLVVITAVSGRQGGVARYLHVLAIDDADSAHSPTGRPGLMQVHHMRLPSADTVEAPHHETTKVLPLNYRLDVVSGSLTVLDNGSVVSYDLARSVPRIVSRLSVPGIASFLRLSKSSVLAATPTAFSVYNPVFQSLQASTTLDDLYDSAAVGETESGERDGEDAPRRFCSLVSFFPQLELAVALVDSSLVAIQLEPPRIRSKKRRADGLLIDSIGRGVLRADDKVAEEAGSLPKSCLPGTMTAGYLAQLKEDIQTADKLLEQRDVAAFDEFLAQKLGIQAIPDWQWQRPLDTVADGADAMDEDQDEGHAPNATNGLANGLASGTGSTHEQPSKATPAKTTPPSTITTAAVAATKRVKYPQADRSWILYAIGRVFSLNQQRPDDRLRLRCTQPKSGIVNYLVDAGHLSVANLRSALRGSLRDADGDDDVLLADALPAVLAHIDPSLDLLLRWLYETTLGAPELLSAVLLLMQSLELVDRTAPDLAAGPKLLTNGYAAGENTTHNSADNNDDDDDKIHELDCLDEQLHLAEYFLQHVDNDPRDLALDIAIGKLGSCPAVATVQGLRRVFRTDEIRALVEVLRKQLVDQGWATRYLDMEDGTGGYVDNSNSSNNNNKIKDVDEQAAATPLNSSIQLIADLLCRCIDAIRPGEWLIDDAVVADAGFPGGALPAPPLSAAPATPNGVVGAFAGAANGGAAAGGDFFASLKWQVSAALEGVQEALYLRGLLGEAVRYGLNVQTTSKAAAAVSAAAVSTTTAAASAAGANGAGDHAQKPVRIGTVLSAAAPSATAGLLPLGLRPLGNLGRTDDVTPTKIVSGGEVVKRSRREKRDDQETHAFRGLTRYGV